MVASEGLEPPTNGLQLFDQRRELRIVRSGRAGKRRHGLAVAVDDEFVEIPFRPLAGQLGQVGIQGVGRQVCDARFLELRKVDAVGGAAEFRDFLVGARLLTEVVGREADDDQPAILVLPVHGLEPLVLMGVAAVARRVDDEQHLALELT